MTAAPFSDGVISLALAPDAQRSRTLLKAATELYVSEPGHTRTELAIYEELAMQLMRATPVDDRVRVSRLLAGHPDAPPAVLALLAADEPEVAAPVIAGAPDLPDMVLLALVAQGSPSHLALVAARPGLSEAVVEALVRTGDPAAVGALIVNADATLPEALLPLVIEAARGRPDLAAALARRHADVEDADLTDLFLDLDVKGRRRVLQALEILALRDFAARRPPPRAPVADPDTVAELGRVALSRDPDRMARVLSRLTGHDPEVSRRIAADPGGEALVVALKAAGIDAGTATRVVLFTGEGDVRNYFEVKRLVELFETLSLRSATILSGRWRPDAGPLPRRRAHRPQTEAGTPVRPREDARPAAARPRTGAPARRDRG